MANYRIKKGDTVQMVAGKDRGKNGKVLRVNRGEGTLVVEGLNMMKKSVRPRAGAAGQMIEVPRTVDISNVMLFDEDSKARTRTGMKSVDGGKVRFAKKTGNTI